MYRHILKIGNAQYTFNRAALCAFIAEARLRAAEGDAPPAPGGARLSQTVGAGGAADEALNPVFREADQITELYRTYRLTRSVEALLELKRRLEEVSVLYQSYALAAEVISINSCLPYERRVPHLHPSSRA